MMLWDQQDKPYYDRNDKNSQSEGMSWKKRQKGNEKIIDRVIDDICQKRSYRSWLIDLEMDRPLPTWEWR
jgi:hypothetical protein